MKHKPTHGCHFLLVFERLDAHVVAGILCGGRLKVNYFGVIVRFHNDFRAYEVKLPILRDLYNIKFDFLGVINRRNARVKVILLIKLTLIILD